MKWIREWLERRREFRRRVNEELALIYLTDPFEFEPMAKARKNARRKIHIEKYGPKSARQVTNLAEGK